MLPVSNLFPATFAEMNLSAMDCLPASAAASLPGVAPAEDPSDDSPTPPVVAPAAKVIAPCRALVPVKKRDSYAFHCNGCAVCAPASDTTLPTILAGMAGPPLGVCAFVMCSSTSA